jgi:putative membrane protein
VPWGALILPHGFSRFGSLLVRLHYGCRVEPSATSWDPAWDEVAAVCLLSVAYAIASIRLGTTRWRTISFGAAMVLALAVLVTPLGTLATHYLLSAHLLQNVVLAEWAPALAVLGLSPALASRLGAFAPVRLLTRPFVALPLWVLTYAVWHVPGPYEAALTNPPLLRLEHLTYFLAGCCLWWPVFQSRPHDLPNGAKAAYLFAAFLLNSPVGLLLALLPSPIYGFYESAPRLRDLGPLTDQQIAGVIMAASEAIVFFGIFAVYVLRFLAEEERA